MIIQFDLNFILYIFSGDFMQKIVDSIYDKILSNNSVDLNEELVDLVKYQTAYSAAAQVFNTCNNCLDVLMTLGN